MTKIVLGIASTDKTGRRDWEVTLPMEIKEGVFSKVEMVGGKTIMVTIEGVVECDQLIEGETGPVLPGTGRRPGPICTCGAGGTPGPTRHAPGCKFRTGR